jgi:hypothetical protein
MSMLNRHVLTLFASPSAPLLASPYPLTMGSSRRQVPLTPQIFAPGVVSGPANDGLPASPDGNTIFFTRSTANWGVIVEAHQVDGHWTQRRSLPSPANGLTRPPPCRRMGPILYLNRTGRRFRELLIPKKETPSLTSSPIFGG